MNVIDSAQKRAQEFYAQWRSAATPYAREDAFRGFCDTAWVLCAHSISRYGIWRFLDRDEVWQEYRIVVWRVLRYHDPACSRPVTALLQHAWKCRLLSLVIREHRHARRFVCHEPAELAYISDVLQ